MRVANGAAIDALVGTEPDTPMRRSVAIMAVCHAWIAMSRAVAEYEFILKEEGK
jgi:hypothetical protein